MKLPGRQLGCLILTGALLLTSVSPAFATDLQQQINDAESQGAALASQKDEAQQKIDSLSSQLDSVKAEITTTEASITSKNDEIETAEEEYTQAKIVEENQYEAMKLRIKYMDNTYDLIPAVKPQIAMYEQFGVPGVAAFAKTVRYCKEKGLVVIGDVKRGDIGSTSAAYAAGHLGEVQVGSKSYVAFDEDFATVNPYLGSDGVNPFVDVCKKYDKGLFILVKTSNPSSGEFQDRLIDGRPLYEWVGEQVAKWGEDCVDGAYSNIGAVVGATYPEMGKTLRRIMERISGIMEEETVQEPYRDYFRIVASFIGEIKNYMEALQSGELQKAPEKTWRGPGRRRSFRSSPDP